MHSCDFGNCNASFGKRWILNRHKKTIHGDEKWSCDQCGKDYARKDKLQVHKQTVHSSKTHKCGFCHKELSRKDKLMSHIRKAHTDVPEQEDPTPTKRQRLAPGWVEVQRRKALRGALQSFTIQGEGKDPAGFLKSLEEDIQVQTESILMAQAGLKLSLCLQAKFYKPVDPEKAEKAHFWSNQTVINTGDDILTKIQSCFPKILTSIDEFTRKGSGWSIHSIVSCEIHFARYRPLRGSTTINLPAYIKSKRTVVNIHNVDEKCFLWCIIASHPRFNHLVHRECVDIYTPYEGELNMAGIRLPVEVRQIPKFEKQNNLTINVYGYENDHVTTVYISEGSGSHHVNLLLYRDHYFWIRSLDRLLGDQRKHEHKKHFCHRCLFPFYSKDRLDEHVPRCGSSARIEMSKKSNIQFENVHKQLKQPVVVYADFECLLESMEEEKGSSLKFQRHVPCGYGLIETKSCCQEAQFNKYEGYRGPDCVRKFLLKLEQIGLAYQDELNYSKPLTMSPEDEQRHDSCHQCHICKGTISKDETKVKDHCHICGRYRGPAHNSCNQGYRLSRDVVVVFHNLRRYDGHILVRELGAVAKELGKELSCIARSMEDYLSFRIHTPKSNEDNSLGWSIRFIDSFQFLSSSLDVLVQSMGQTGFRALEAEFLDTSLLFKKGVYPYDYMDCHERFAETRLPSKDKFYSKLNQQHITDEDYQHAQLVWQCYGIKNLGQYHDHYLKSDTCQLADVMEQFRGVCLDNYGLDPMHYITLPSFGWDACLKITKVKLETLQDPDMYSFFESGIRGGISVISHRYAKANNPKCPDYKPDKPTSYLMYLDANNLYGWAMIQKMPTHGFHWVPPTSNIDWATTDNGYILEVDLDYPEHLHNIHSDYPLAPEKIEVPKLSPYCTALKTALGLNCSLAKLIPNLNAKKNYIVHIKNLQQYLSLGMVLKKVHRVIGFEQSSWMEPYIMLNTRLRTSAATDLAKNLFKLMNNAVFGKTMEDVRGYKDIKLVTSEEKLEKLVANPRFKRSAIFTSDLVGVAMERAKIVLDKPIYCGFTVLDLSKTLMYDFHYNYMLPKYGPKARLLFTDTDSFIYHITTPDVYADMHEDQHLFDTSGYPKGHPLHSLANKKVIGKMKDELDGWAMFAFCGLRSKMYNFTSENGEHPKAKGIKKATVKRIPFEDFTNALFSQQEYKHTMNLIRSENHQLFTVAMMKKSLTPYDDKRYILNDGVTTLAYGHKEIPVEEPMNIGD